MTRPLILRRDPPGSLIDTDRRIEFAAYRAFHATSVPVPEALWLELDPKWLDFPFFVMAELQGFESSPQALVAPPYAEHAVKLGRRKWTILGDPERRAVAQPHSSLRGGQRVSGGKRNHASGGEQPFAAQDHRAVMHRRVRVKNLQQEFGGDFRVQPQTRRGKIVQSDVPLDHQQCAVPPLGKPLGGGDDRLNVRGNFRRRGRAAEKIRPPDPLQGPADLRREYDRDHDQERRQNRLEDPGNRRELGDAG